MKKVKALFILLIAIMLLIFIPYWVGYSIEILTDADPDYAFGTWAGGIGCLLVCITLPILLYQLYQFILDRI